MSADDGSIHVLHVDDEPDLADMAADFLERANDQISVVTAESASEGLNVIADTPVDCVVSDYDMPGANGIEFLREVREDHPDLPFILFTGKGSEEVASEAISNGVTEYMQKEVGTDQYLVLANRIENAVDQYRAQRTLERTRRRFRLLVEEATDAVLIVAPDGSFEYATPTATAVLGRPPEELVGMNGFDLVHPDDLERVQTEFTHIIENPDHRRAVEFRYEQPDGSWGWVEARGRNLLDNPVIEGVVVYVRDIAERKERELELRETERKYRAIFNDPNILVGSIATDGTVLDINETAMEYVDATVEEVAGQPFWETPWFRGDDDVQADVREWITRAADGEYVEFEADLVRPDGDPYSIEGVFRPVRDEDGEVESLIISDREITERKRRERELHQERDRFHAVFEEAFDAMVIADDEGRYIDVNQSATELFGLPADELLGRSIADFSPEDFDFEAAWQAFQASEEERGTFPLVGADGTERLVEYAATRDIVPGEHLSVLRDVTEREEREQELQRVRDRMEFALESTDAIVWDWDVESDEATFYPSEESLYGTTVEDWDDFIDIVHPEDRHRVEAAVERSLETGSPKHEAFRIRDDGEVRWIEGPGQRLDDNPTRMIGVARDVTERKQRERALERQNERLDQFTSVVSHDLRNPLNVAQGQLELARDDCESPHLDQVARAHDRMGALIDDLLSLARDGRFMSETGPVDLAELIDECWRTIETANADLVIETDRTVEADRSRLQQLVENLLQNAVEHGGESVTVTIGDLETGFYVEDDGPGIPRDARDDVFRAGFSTSDGGTGFGLTIAEQVAEAHGWDLRLRADEGGGARFEITGVVDSG